MNLSYMPIKEFPPVTMADNETGLLAIGGTADVESLILAYKSGIFPWPVTNEKLLLWFAPLKRAVLFLENFHISKTLNKIRNHTNYTFKIDRDFEKVIRSCAESGTRKSNGTWVTPDIIHGYLDLHRAGYAHSIECYKDDQLVGGLYGVSIGRMFAGESMFHVEPDTSKLCLCYLVDYLNEQGVKWMDCQQLTPLLQSFGAIEIEQSEFMNLLNEATNDQIDLFANTTQQLRM